MTQYLPESYVTQYTTNFELLSQQRETKLMQYMKMLNLTGEAGQVLHQFGEIEFRKTTDRNADTQYSQSYQTSRWIHPESYSNAQYFSSLDKIRSAIDYQAPFLEQRVAAFERLKEEVIVDALFGKAQMSVDKKVTDVEIPNTQILSAGGTGLTVNKLREAMVKLKKSHALPNGVTPICVVSSQQMDDLLGETSVTSIDYNNVKALTNGMVDNFMGFKFVESEMLPYDANGDRKVGVFVPGSMYYVTWGEAEKIRVGENPGKEWRAEIFHEAHLSATRVEEKKVVVIPCVE